jgi:hypothetical protein
MKRRARSVVISLVEFIMCKDVKRETHTITIF